MEERNLIERPIYMDKIGPYIGKSLIKVITGQRRVGKSFILKAVEAEIRKKNPDANIIYLDLEDFAFAHIRDKESLHQEITKRLSNERKNVIFIDEIQEVDDFDQVVRSLIKDENNDIYITGSNSKMLSSELSSALAGRSIEIRVHPLSYKEFLDFQKVADCAESLNTYLRYGGLPYLVNLPQQSTWNEYLSGVTDAVVYRDIVSRYNIRNNDFLQRLLLFLADNIGQIFSAKRISDFLKSQKVTASVSGVQNYIEYLREAYIVNRVGRWDVEGKRFFEIGEKLFFEDLGIRNSIIGYNPMHISGLIENAVYNHLSVKGYKVKVGVLANSGEIDFIADKDGESKYIQVALTIAGNDTFEREFGNLIKIPDNYEKIVVSFNESAPNTYKGIRMLNLREFLTTF